MASYLLSLGADPNLVNDEGNTALHEAALANSHAVASLLARHQTTDPNVRRFSPNVLTQILKKNSLDQQWLAHLAQKRSERPSLQVFCLTVAF